MRSAGNKRVGAFVLRPRSGPEQSLLDQDYSPEQITGSLKKQNLPTVSHERIYQHIWEDKKKGGMLYTRLRRRAEGTGNEALLKIKEDAFSGEFVLKHVRRL